jgi:hypothetical protein
MAKAKVDRAVNIWTARIIPIVLIGVVGYATYVLVVRLCGMYRIFCETVFADSNPQSITSSIALRRGLAS